MEAMVRHPPSLWSDMFAVSPLVDFLASFLSRLCCPFPIGVPVYGTTVMSYSPSLFLANGDRHCRRHK